ncbi:MAG: hypothetical protein E4H16_04830 [Candidatus Atribacteria bacterium]|nr:MAG: hypothetical protein E4H16_04830 [Candidatus Atribacteria bacterium]
MILSAFAAGVQAHSGSIGLYTDANAADCDMDVPPYVPTNIYVVYFKSDSGPDGITGAEFKVEISNAQVLLLVPVWAPGTMTIGAVQTGIAVTFGDVCTGSGSATVYLGILPIMSQMAFDWTMRVLASPVALEPDNVWVSQCDATASLHAVLGGWFHEGDGACTLPVESSSWGAIKSMYNE